MRATNTMPRIAERATADARIPHLHPIAARHARGELDACHELISQQNRQNAFDIPDTRRAGVSMLELSTAAPAAQPDYNWMRRPRCTLRRRTPIIRTLNGPAGYRTDSEDRKVVQDGQRFHRTIAAHASRKQPTRRDSLCMFGAEVTPITLVESRVDGCRRADVRHINNGRKTVVQLRCVLR
jgi:hypothetical protein